MEKESGTKGQIETLASLIFFVGSQFLADKYGNVTVISWVTNEDYTWPKGKEYKFKNIEIDTNFSTPIKLNVPDQFCGAL